MSLAGKRILISGAARGIGALTAKRLHDRGARVALLGLEPELLESVAADCGTYNLIRAAGPHVSHPGGYFLVTASLAAAVHLPLMAAYCASKAAVESLGDSLRMELAPTGVRSGVAYYAELDTDMTSRGFATKAAARMPIGGHGRLPVAPVEPAIDAIERGIVRRSRRIVSPRWVAAALPLRMVVQRLAERQVRGRIGTALDIARTEEAPLTTPQPERVA